MSTSIGSPPLVGVPSPEFDESPSSWLARAALSQGIPMRNLLDYLDLPGPCEFDFFVLSERMPHALKVAGVSAQSLQVAKRILLNLRKVDDDGRKYLIRSSEKIQYRYCAPCFSAQRQKYLPIHWRFKAWQWCPCHLSIMRDGCSRCGAPCELPSGLIRANGGEGIGSLDLCLRCGHRLASTATQDLGELKVLGADEWKRALIHNGRALLAALYQGHFFLGAEGEKMQLWKLKKVEGLVPNDVAVWPDRIDGKAATAV